MSTILPMILRKKSSAPWGSGSIASMIYILQKIAVRAKLTSSATVQPAPTDSIRAFSTATNISELQDLGVMEKTQEMAVTRIQTLGSNAALQSRLWTASASKLTPRSPSLTIQQMPSYSNRSILCRNMPYTKRCSCLELGNERILREIQMIPWSCKQKQSAQLNSQRPFSQVARCPTHHEQVYQAERTSMPPPNVQTKTRHGLHKASCCHCFFKKLWKSHFLPLKIFVKHQVIRSLFHLWTDHDYHHGSICPLQQKDQSHFVTNAMTCQGSSRSTLWQTPEGKNRSAELTYPTLQTGKSSLGWDMIWYDDMLVPTKILGYSSYLWPLSHNMLSIYGPPQHMTSKMFPDPG